MRCPECGCEMHTSYTDNVTGEDVYICPRCYTHKIADGSEEPIDDYEYDKDRFDDV